MYCGSNRVGKILKDQQTAADVGMEQDDTIHMVRIRFFGDKMLTFTG